MHRVLLIWESLPETIHIYDLYVTSQELERLHLCHGRMIGWDIPEETQMELLWLWEQIQPEYQGMPAGPWASCVQYDSEKDSRTMPLLFSSDNQVHVICTGIVL